MSRKKEDSDNNFWFISILGVFVLMIIVVGFTVYKTNLELEPEREKVLQV